MKYELLGALVMFLGIVLPAIPLGKYIAKVYAGEKTVLDFFAPLERLLFRLSGIDPNKEMTWKEHLMALLTINLIWFVYGFVLLLTQQWLPLNPDHNPNMTPDQAFNTVISFIVNCNLQHYSGETGLTYLTQLIVIMFSQFMSAAAGMAVCAVVFNAMRERKTDMLGNFYNYFIKSCTRILLPLSIVVAVILLLSGTPMTFKAKDNIITMQGDTVQVSRGPVAGMVGIKQMGTNGGGWFGVNSAHPFENPTYFTNMVENISIPFIAVAMVFALGYYLKRRKLALMVFGVMTVGVIILLIPTVYLEMNGNPAIAKMGIDQSLGSMEGKEMRLGSVASAFWAITTTVTSNGSANCAHDSLTALSGLFTMLGMMINSLWGGVGVGFLNFYIFIIIAVFISGLMVGRTPEFLGKKIEAKEMKIATVVALLHPLLILSFTALSSYVYHKNPGLPWLNNPSFHGFSEMLYEYTSSSANNGSSFGVLPDYSKGAVFWNITCGLVLIFSRYIPIIGPIAIAGILANKKYIPESAGTLKTDTATFGIMVAGVIFIIAALAFFQALTLGPIAEYFSMR